MASKLELNWFGKEERIHPEPRLLIENPKLSYKKESMSLLEEDSFFDNLLIHGDNLLGLKALESNYTGRIKCIFIDPPYNTGSAFEHYDDNVEHSIWLSLMRERLEILKGLMAKDGTIWIVLDDSELHYSKSFLELMVGYDGVNYNFSFESISKSTKCSEGCYKVALVIAPNQDYHWYRQNSDGTWSHKPGNGYVIKTDYQSQVIYDPQYCDRRYNYDGTVINYSVFCGFYQVNISNINVDIYGG